jgi:hypothetical protein
VRGPLVGNSPLELLLENSSPGLNANSQFANNESRVLRKREIKVYYSSDEEEDRESQLLKVL